MNPSPEEATSPTDTEAKLASWWKELLGVEVVRPEDHFLEIGGNSLMATVLSNRIESELGVEVSMAELFNTLRAVATLCDELRQEQSA
ncbi:phosphopantetheine-binding protein [Corallococcus exiguus]|uniref:phosphopantetheine-binding protein n=1 Tax=Corallococcus exiguus TaxID=83462 RepID=UPI003DA2F7D1